MIYVVNVSGGLTSFEALDRCILRHGRANTRAYFADVKGHSTDQYAGEHADLYRFLADQETFFGIKIERVVDGRDIWQTMKDEGYITMMSQYGLIAPCSMALKRDAIEQRLAIDFAGQEVTRVFGYEWSEVGRMESLAQSIAPVPCWFPLSEPPYVDKCHIAAKLEQFGIKVPELYDQGATHNNCGGGCVKAGQAQFAWLWRTDLPRYLYWEAKEEEVRQYLGKDVAILRDRRGGRTIPMTLHTFRLRLEAGEAYDTDEWGGCGCFAPVAQSRMDEMLLTTAVAPKKRAGSHGRHRNTSSGMATNNGRDERDTASDLPPVGAARSARTIPLALDLEDR